MKQIIVITGPTASSKSSLAIKLAKDIDAEIINADSFQVYKEINAGVNKPTPQQLSEVKHHLISSHSIYDDFDIKIFQDECNVIIDDILSRNKHVIICGGSNLYIDAVIKGYNLDKSPSRGQTTYFDNWDYDDIYNYVLERDKEEALKINYNNKKRIIRAAQIIHMTNQKKSALDTQKDNYIFDCFIIETIKDREELYELINNRVDVMIDNDWVNEVKLLLNKDANIANLQALKAIGYPQIIQHIQTNQPIDTETIKQITRNLAKKQMTWCRTKYANKHVFNTNHDKYEELLNQVRNWLVS